MTSYRAVTRLRKVLFWVFAALFLLTWPPLLFYTLGIAPARGSDELLTETGAIRVESVPSDAAVLFNGNRLDDTTPAVLDRIKPGTHTLRIEKQGHEPWVGSIEIKPRAVVRITPAVLPHALQGEPTLLSRLPIQDVAMAAEGQYIGLVPGTVGQFSVVNAEEESAVALAGELVQYADDPVLRVQGTANGSRFYLWAGADGDRRLLVVEAGNQLGTLEASVTNPLVTAAELVFEPTLSSDIVLYDGSRLLRLESWSDEDPDVLSRKARAAAVFENALFYLENDGTVGQVTGVGRHAELFDLPEEEGGALSGRSSVRLIHATDEWVGYLTEQGVTIGTKGEIRRYPDLVGGYADPNRERLIVWSSRRFGALPYRVRSDQSEGASEVRWMGGGHASDAVVEMVYSVAGGTHVLYGRDQAVWVQPVIPSVEAEPTAVLTGLQQPDFWYSSASGKLLWSTGDGLAMEKVVADEPLIMLE